MLATQTSSAPQSGHQGSPAALLSAVSCLLEIMFGSNAELLSTGCSVLLLRVHREADGKKPPRSIELLLLGLSPGARVNTTVG